LTTKAPPLARDRGRQVSTSRAGPQDMLRFGRIWPEGGCCINCDAIPNSPGLTYHQG
jgi:hypothetical protein